MGGMTAKPWFDFKAIWLSALFFLAAIVKPYVMAWWRCKARVDVIAMAGNVMLLTTLFVSLIVSLSASTLADDLAMYINWVLLWGASTYFVLVSWR